MNISKLLGPTVCHQNDVLIWNNEDRQPEDEQEETEDEDFYW